MFLWKTVFLSIISSRVLVLSCLILGWCSLWCRAMVLPPRAMLLFPVVYELKIRPSFLGKDCPVKVADMPLMIGFEGGKEGLLLLTARSPF